ncbi:MAG: hypothetical protein ACI4MV_07065 [Christensenellales bacterium]
MCKGVILNVIAVGHWQSQVLCHCEAFEKRCGNLVRFVVVAMYSQNSNVIASLWRGNLYPIVIPAEHSGTWQSRPFF